MSIRLSRVMISAVAAGLAAALVVAPAPAPAHAAGFDLFPRTIALPDGFQPEGIAIGGPFAYFGSLADGAIYRANLITGAGHVITEGPGTPSVGLALDHKGRLFVAGGPAGDARVVSALTGRVLASYPLATDEAFINDVVVTRDAAWFTDSLNPVVYRVPFGRGGALPATDRVQTLPLTGDYQHEEGFNGNGIESTTDGRGLLLMQTNTGLLFRVDPATGEAARVDLDGATLPFGDGILRHGRTLYVVQNQLNQVAVVTLRADGSRGSVVNTLTDPAFDVPTTVARFGPWLYLPNARFGTPPTPDTPYTAVAIRR